MDEILKIKEESDNMKLHGQTILITGGSSGIGLAFANELSQNNTIIICGRDNVKLDNVKKNNSTLNITQCDVSDENSIKNMVKNLIHHFPNLNVLINNAGVMNIHEVKNNSLPFDNQMEEIKTNLMATVSLSDKFIPHFMKQKEAAIINVTSGLAYMPFELAPVYTATKAAIHSYSQSMRIALKNTPISIVEILPPMVDTNMSKGLEMPGIKKITAQKMVKYSINKIENGKKEIQPGSSAMMIRMYKLFPGMTSKMMSKMAPKVLASYQDFILNKN